MKHRTIKNGNMMLKSTMDEVQPLIDNIIDELDRAESKFPMWPIDIVHGTAIMVEEAGESMQAALNATYHDGDIQALEDELVQTAAMAIRMLIYMGRQ